MGSALAPREKFHVWTYQLHFFITLIHPSTAHEPGFSSHFWFMPALLNCTWVTFLCLHRPGAIQHLFTCQYTKIFVPGRQTSHAGSALALAHLALLFHWGSKITLWFCPVSHDFYVPMFIREGRFSKEPASVAIPQLPANEQTDLLVI